MKTYLKNNILIISLFFFSLLCFACLITLNINPLTWEKAFAIDSATSTSGCYINVEPKVITFPQEVKLTWNSPSSASSSNYWLYGIYPDRNGRSVEPVGSINVMATKTQPFTFKYTVNGTTVSCSTRLDYRSTLSSCNFNGRIIPHGSSTIAFLTDSVTSPSLCSSQERVCNNGILSGGYYRSSCTQITNTSTSTPTISECTMTAEPQTSFGLNPITLTWSTPSTSTNHVIWGIPIIGSSSVSSSGTLSVNATNTTAFLLTYRLGGVTKRCSAWTYSKLFKSPANPNVPVKPEVVLGLFGQSFAEGLFKNPARESFAREINNAGYPLEIVTHGSGGSSALKENSGGTDRWWWDLDAGKPGPQLLAAIETINNYEKKPTVILWLQGEGDSLYPNLDQERYYKATAQILWALKKAANPSNPNSVKTYMHVIGRRMTSATADLPGIQKIRDKQTQLIRMTGVDFLVDTWDLELLGDSDPVNHPYDSHMSPAGYVTFGWRTAQTILGSLSSSSNQSPYLSAIRNLNGKTVRLQFATRTDTTHSNLTNPLRPSHIAVKVGNTLYTNDKLTFKWINNKVLDVSIGVATTTPITVMYPYGSLQRIDRSNIIKDGYGTAIQSFSITK